MIQRQVAWINDFGDTYVCTTVEFISGSIKKKTTEDYIHKYNRRPFHEEKKRHKIINITIAEGTSKVWI